MSRFTILAILVSAVVVAGMCLAIWYAWRKPASVPIEVTVVSVRGSAAWSRMGIEKDLQAGQRLQSVDTVKTKRDGRVILRFEDGTRVILEPETSVRIGELDQSLSKLRFDYGLMAADVIVNPSRKFLVEALDGQATAETPGAGFEVAGDNGIFVVAVSSGSVSVKGRGGEAVRVESGQRTLVRKGEAAAPARTIPDSVFLEVRWPPSVLRERRATVRGSTEPGSRVTLEGQIVPLDGQGNFSKDLDLAPGANRLRVESRQIGGKTKEAVSPAIEVDNQPPRVEVDTERLWRAPDAGP